MRTGRVVMLTCCVLGIGSLARAEAPAAGSQSLTVRQYAGLNPQCTGFSNGCETCVRTEFGIRCSMPGIACQPRHWRCNGAKPVVQTAPPPPPETTHDDRF